MKVYHVWFSTKGRKPALEGEIGEDVKRLIKEIAQRTAIQVLEIEAAADHAHLLLALTDGQTLPSVMHQLKGASARAVFLKYPDLRIDMKSKSFWQKDYGSREVTASEIDVVRLYIRTQSERPLRHAD